MTFARDGLTAALLAAVALVAGAWDLLARRIPNWLTFPAAAAGLAWHSYRDGWLGLLLAAAGLALGFAVFLPFFLLGGMGAGDVKLMAAVGALAGPQALVAIFIYTGLLGGLAGLVLAAARKRLRATLASTVRLLGQFVRLRRGTGPNLERGQVPPLRLPYGVVIAGGCALFLLTRP